MEKPQAKSKVKARHEEAIREFQRWLASHPKATIERRIQVFDRFVDGNPPTKKRKRVSASR